MKDIKSKRECISLIMDIGECHELAIKILFKRLCKLEKEVEELKRSIKENKQ